MPPGPFLSLTTSVTPAFGAIANFSLIQQATRRKMNNTAIKFMVEMNRLTINCNKS
jgi:hypothetical protein